MCWNAIYQIEGEMSGKAYKANTGSSPKSASSDKEELRARERISTKHGSRASAESSRSPSNNDNNSNAPVVTRADSQAPIVHPKLHISSRTYSRSDISSPSPEHSRKNKSKKSPIKKEGPQLITSAVVFENFDENNPCKFLEDSIIAMDPIRVYAALQHGMVCEPEFKVNNVKLEKILKKPSKGPQTGNWKSVMQYLKAFTIMHKCDDVSVFPVSSESINTKALKSKFKLDINIIADERESISGIIDQQFNTDMGNIFLLVHKVHKMCQDKSPLCNTVYEWYTDYQKDHEEVIYVLENDDFLDVFYESNGQEEECHTITHRDILNEVQPPSSSVSY